MLDYRNNFVGIDIILTQDSKEVICTFRGSSPTVNTRKMCKISIANGISCQSALKGSNNNTASSGNTVSINLNNLIRDADEGKRFCYNLTARDDTEQLQVVVQSIIFIEITAVENTGSSPALVSIVVVLIALVVIVIVLLIILYVSFLRDDMQYIVYY